VGFRGWGLVCAFVVGVLWCWGVGGGGGGGFGVGGGLGFFFWGFGWVFFLVGVGKFLIVPAASDFQPSLFPSPFQ